jgi:hypothetical protein
MYVAVGAGASIAGGCVADGLGAVVAVWVAVGSGGAGDGVVVRVGGTGDGLGVAVSVGASGSVGLKVGSWRTGCVAVATGVCAWVATRATAVRAGVTAGAGVVDV